MKFARTDRLEIAYEEGGPADGRPVLLLHGWPDAPCGWDAIASRLNAYGWRTIAPYLRGSGPTKFLSSKTPRVGAGLAIAQDAVDLADRLQLERFAIVGHDWGARAAYTVAALYPNRVTSIAALAQAYQPQGLFTIPSFEQARRFWYQWFLCTDGGAAKFQSDPVGFARLQWEAWSPAGWFTATEFEQAAESFANPDWALVTLNAYRSRWREGQAWDAGYDGLQRKLRKTATLSTPTLMLQGAADNVDPPSESEGLEAHFTGGYKRVVLDGVGHFPHREVPDMVATAVLRHLRDRE